MSRSGLCRCFGAMLVASFLFQMPATAQRAQIGSWIEFGSGGEAIEGRDGFDQARDGERIQYTAAFADKMKSAAIAPQRYGHANQRRDTGTVNLRDVDAGSHVRIAG